MTESSGDDDRFVDITLGWPSSHRKFSLIGEDCLHRVRPFAKSVPCQNKGRVGPRKRTRISGVEDETA